MRKPPDPENFKKLLAWLDADADAAGLKYNHLHDTLIKIFVRRGCLISEDLTDETIDRVCSKIDEITKDYVGDPALYFYKVAKYVWLEYVKKKPEPKPLPPYEPADNQEKRMTCLDQCLSGLNGEDRELLLRYFQDEKRAKINQRRAIAKSLNISLDNLRVKIHRLKAELRECVKQCLQ